MINTLNTNSRQPMKGIIKTSTKTFSCNGIILDSGNNFEILYSPHPKVYLTFDEKNNVKCPYCSTEYVFDEK